MPQLTSVVSFEILLLIGGLFALVTIGIFSGQINLRGLFRGRRNQKRYLSPERIQLFILTLGFAFQYLSQVIESRSGEFPPVSEKWIAILLGSHAVYLGRKAYSKFYRKPPQEL